MCHCQTDQNYNLIVLISGALHTKSVSNGARRSWFIDFQMSGITRNMCQCQTDQSYNLIVLISGALHTKSVSNGSRTSWLYRDFRWAASHEFMCQCQTDQSYNLIVLISGALSHEICVKWREEIMIYRFSDERHHTKSLSNGPKRSWLLWFQRTGITRNLCQCQIDQNYNLDFFDFRCHVTRKLCEKARGASWFIDFQVSGIHTKSLSNGPKRSWLLWFQRTRHHTKFVSVSKWSKLTIWFFWFQVSLHTKSVLHCP